MIRRIDDKPRTPRTSGQSNQVSTAGPEPSRPDAAPASSGILQSVLRRRRGAGSADHDLEAGVVRSSGRDTGAMRGRTAVLYPEARMPVSYSAALGGFQFWNVDKAGPASRPEAPQWAPLEAAQFRHVVPPAGGRLRAANEALESARASLAAPVEAPQDEPGWLEGAATASARLFGLQARPVVALKDVVALRPGADGHPDHFRHYMISQLTAGKVGATVADVAAAQVGLRLDEFAACLKADHDPRLHAAVDAHVARSRSLARAFHEARAGLHLLEHEDEPAQARDRLRQAQQDFERHQARMPEIRREWRQPFREMLALESEAIGVAAGQARTVHAAGARMRRVQEDRLRSLAERPPGQADLQPAFAAQLEALRQRLLRPAPGAHALAPDDVMEMTLQAAAQAFGEEGLQHDCAQALHALGGMDVGELPALLARPADPATRLAMALGRLPRGVEILARTCGSSAFLAPRSAPGAKVDKALAERRTVALRYLCVAAQGLEGADLPAQARDHLELARGAALDLLRSPGCEMTSLPDDKRHAFNCVRNQFHELGPGSTYAEAVARMKQVSGPMLESTARETTMQGTLARYNPLAEATPFNPAAMSAAGIAMKQGRLISEPLEAVRELRAAALTLRRGAAASPAEKALAAVSDAVLAAVDDKQPQRIGTLAAGDVDLPARFGLTEAELEKEPSLQALWRRHASRDRLDRIATAVEPWLRLGDARHQRALRKQDIPENFGLAAEEVDADPRLASLRDELADDRVSGPDAAARLARIARDDLMSASQAAPGEILRELAQVAAEGLRDTDKNAARQATDFRKALDLARASGIWDDARIDTRQQLADAIVALFRVKRLRSRTVLKGDKTLGVDLAKLPLAFGFGPESLNLRLNAGGKFQSGFNLEFGLSTSSYYAIVGEQKNVGGKLGAVVGGGAHADLADGRVTLGGRFAEVGAAGSGDQQWQNGLRVLIPRDKSTEAKNLAECEMAMRQMVLWQDFGYGDPGQAVLSNVDAASLNVLGKYDRTSVRMEGSLGVAPVQVGAWALQGRVGETLRTFADSKWGELQEASGYYKVQDVRIDHATQQSGTHGATMTARAHAWKVGGQGEDGHPAATATLSLADMASVSKEGKLPQQDYAILRLVTLDDELLPKRSRLIQAYSAMAPYKAAMEADRSRWIRFGADYTKFPEHFTDAMKLQASERDYDTWFADLDRHHTRFSEYGVVKCLQDEVPASFDALSAKLAQNQSGRPGGAARREADLQAQANLLLSDPNSWEPRRSSNNLTSVQANRPGFVLGLQVGSGGDAYVIDNLQLLPRA